MCEEGQLRLIKVVKWMIGANPDGPGRGVGHGDERGEQVRIRAKQLGFRDFRRRARCCRRVAPQEKQREEEGTSTTARIRQRRVRRVSGVAGKEAGREVPSGTVTPPRELYQT